jgi:hypothetical protein
MENISCFFFVAYFHNLSILPTLNGKDVPVLN